MHPDLGRKVFDKQSDQKARHDKGSRERESTLGEHVLVQNFRGEPKWLDGTVTEQTGPVSYKVLVGDQLWKRHVDQMHQKRGSQIDPPNCNTDVSVTFLDYAVSNEVVDVSLTTSPTPQLETAETATLEPT